MITLNKNTYQWGDSPISATNSPTYALPFWEISNGSIVSQFSNTTEVIPGNVTDLLRLVVYDAQYFTGAINSGTTFANNSISGTGTSYFPTQTLYVPSQETVYFVEGGASSNCVIGFSASLTSLEACFYVSNSMATIYVSNTPVHGFIVANNARLRVKIVNGETFYFYIDGNLVFSTGVYPRLTSAYPNIRVTASTVNNAIYYHNTDKDGEYIDCISVLPIQPNYPYDVQFTEGSLSDTSEDNTTISLERPDKKIYTFNFNLRPKEEFDLLNKFWEDNGTSKPFFFIDLVEGKSIKLKFDNLKYTVTRINQFNITASVKQA